MEQLKNSNIVILPTNDKPELGCILYRNAFDSISLWRYKEEFTHKDGTKVYRTLGGTFEDWYKGMKPHYIYNFSDDKIQRGDYFISFNEDESYLEITLNDQVDDFNDWADVLWTENCKKIITTTDPSLINKRIMVFQDNTSDYIYDLPVTPEEVIEKFVEDYNKAFRKPLSFTISDSIEKVKSKYRLALLQLKEYSDNELIIQEGITLKIEEELNKLKEN